MTIEQVGLEAASACAAVLKSSRAHSLPFLPRLHTFEEDVDFLSRVILTNHVLAALDGERRIVAFIAYGDGWIHHLYVAPERQGAGIGSRLLQDAKAQCERLWLWTFERNIAARRFYEKHGFVVQRRTDGEGNEEKEPDLLLYWERTGSVCTTLPV